MKMTEALKSWLVENCGVAKDADDATFKQAASDALMKGDLSAKKFEELSVEPEDAKTIAEFDAMKTRLEQLEKAAGGEPTPTGTSVIGKMVANQGGTPTSTEAKAAQIQFKDAAEMYDSTRKSLTYPSHNRKGMPHPLAGRPVTEQGRTLYEPSDQDKAVAGAWAKFQIQSERHGRLHERAFASLSVHEQNLLHWATDNAEWDDSKDGRPGTVKGYRGGMKALIDDATSGGLEAAPIVFDDMVIQTPLLHGELYPLVNVVPLDRGRRVEGVATGTVTGSWGGVDATAISLFNTASYVSAFDTTIFRWEGAIQIGLDFMEDTPIDFGAHITAQYGERLLEDLDDVIAIGNGTTQPEGVMNKTGVTSVAFGGATSIGNYESLRFGVAKAEHRANVAATAVFCGNETSYQRARAVPVGSSDARRIFGMDYDGYELMQRPYKINESMANNQVFYAILARYRMYRRKGIAIRTSNEGSTLVRENSMIIVAMARYGGQLERGAAAAVTTTAPA